jgi:hypothetical protein
VEALAREYLEAKRAADEAEARAKAAGAALRARMEAMGRTTMAVKGVGRVSVIAGGMTQSIDSKAAEDALRAAGLDVPLKLSERRSSLRAALNV